MFAIAVVAVLLLSYGKQAALDLDLFTTGLCIVAPATPYDPASGLAMRAPKSIPADARCPVRGMYPARFPRWAAQMVFKDGTSHFFDSPIDLFVFMQGIDRYNMRYALDDVAMNYVTDFETGRWVEAQHAFFVHGSTVLGPMRDADLPAFASIESADSMVRNRGGKVLTFTGVSPELIRTLNRSTRHLH